MEPWVIVVIAVSALLAIGLGVLLYFTVFAHMRYRKQVRELSRRFEYLHALLFGQDSQYIKRIENISLTNLIYVNTYMTFNKRYKEVRDKGDSSAQIAVNSLKDLVADRNYKLLKEELPQARKTIDAFDEEVNQLNNDLLVVIKPEEECRQQSLALKEKLRKIKQDYYIKQADLSLVAPSFDKVFQLLDDNFNEFEGYVESAQYEEARNLLPRIGAVIEELAKAIKVMPNLCVLIQSVIPDKLVSLENRFEEMTKAGFPLHHLIVSNNIDEMREEVSTITKKCQEFKLAGVQEELDGILDRINDYFASFDKEKEARSIFESECDGIYVDEAAVEQKYIRLSNALPDVKKIYVIPEDEQQKIDEIKALINKAGATKRSLDTFIHSGARQPFTLLVEKMHALRDEAVSAGNAIEDFDRYLLSLKTESEDAAGCLSVYDKKLHSCEGLLSDIDIDPISAEIGPQIDELYGIIDQIYGLLKAPIDVTAIHECVVRLKSEGDALYRRLLKEKENMLLADASLLYANRDRQHLSEIKMLVNQSEVRYFKGDFATAYRDTTDGLKRLRGE